MRTTQGLHTWLLVQAFRVRTIPGTFQGTGENPYVCLDAQNTFLTLVTQKGV